MEKKIEGILKLRASDKIVLIIPLFFAILMLFHPVREVVTPFLFGIVFAYILSPLVHILNKKLRLPRLLSILLIFALFVFLIIFLLNKTLVLANQEIRQLPEETQDINRFLNQGIKNFPWWSQDFFQYLTDSLRTLPKSLSVMTVPILRNTFGTIISLFAFFATIFYFLKDSDKISRLLYKSKLYIDINQIIKSYFRGQIFLIVFMIAVTWIMLRVFDIKFAFLLSVFTGFAEIVPYVGPILAGTLAVLVTLLTDSSAFHYTPLATAIFVAIGYFFLRQLEDFFVIPLVIGKSVELHPLIILFTVILAGKLYGVIGLLFGVPFIATYKTIVEYIINEK